jgi:hypothetical protein
MRTGFDTIGNATVIAYDGGPILVTDPWLRGAAYFGSWRLSHEIPEAQVKAALTAKYVWISHGHPDHLNGDSIDLFRGRRILVPDHHGGRIRTDLERQGHDVTVLADRTWVRLSEKIRVLCLPDYNQDAALLIDVGDRLVFDLNDSGALGAARFAREIVKRYDISFLLALFGYGDADMINYRTEEGRLIEPWAARKIPVGTRITSAVDFWGVKYCIPFSSMHRYQRSDSAWANQYTTSLDDYARGYTSKTTELLPAFVRYDCETDTWSRIEPPETNPEILPPEAFGDSWADLLERDDKQRVAAYLRAIEHLSTNLDFINFRVGGKDNFIELRPGRYRRGITFEVPRTSLMSAIEYHVFDDLLIGNFMKTTLHGQWSLDKLQRDFGPHVAKYADNGHARSAEELAAYFDDYRRRDMVGFVLNRFEIRAREAMRASVQTLQQTRAYPAARRIYRFVKASPASVSAPSARE